MSTPRICYYVDETMVTLAGTIPSIVTEGEPGYAPLLGDDGASPWFWGSIATARFLTRQANQELGLCDDDVSAIVQSSMRAGRVNPPTHINYQEV